jgi:hypothetical protein
VARRCVLFGSERSGLMVVAPVAVEGVTPVLLFVVVLFTEEVPAACDQAGAVAKAALAARAAPSAASLRLRVMTFSWHACERHCPHCKFDWSVMGPFDSALAWLA